MTPEGVDEVLRAQLERARALGLLGPGPVDDHLRHAAAFVGALHDIEGTVVDLGSGGGVPGLPVVVARPDLHLVLLDASTRRGAFLQDAVAALGATWRVEVVVGRAEEIGRGPLRGTVDAVMARSFGPPATTAECAAPLLRPGGRLLVSEPPDSADRWPATGLALLHLRAVGPPSGSPRLQQLELAAPCPEAYPRRNGVPGKRPLF